MELHISTMNAELLLVPKSRATSIFYVPGLASLARRRGRNARKKWVGLIDCDRLIDTACCSLGPEKGSTRGILGDDQYATVQSPSVVN